MRSRSFSERANSSKEFARLSNYLEVVQRPRKTYSKQTLDAQSRALRRAENCISECPKESYQSHCMILRIGTPRWNQVMSDLKSGNHVTSQRFTPDFPEGVSTQLSQASDVGIPPADARARAYFDDSAHVIGLRNGALPPRGMSSSLTSLPASSIFHNNIMNITLRRVSANARQRPRDTADSLGPKK